MKTGIQTGGHSPRCMDPRKAPVTGIPTCLAVPLKIFNNLLRRDNSRVATLTWFGVESLRPSKGVIMQPKSGNVLENFV